MVIAFDREWAALDVATFVDELIVRRLGAFSVSVGADFRFGARAAGDAGALAGDLRFVTAVAPMVTIDGDVVSSSRIRDLLAAGDVEAAARLLGRPHTLPARVLPDGRLRIDSALAIPRRGRYAVTVDGTTACATVSDNGVIELGRPPSAARPCLPEQDLMDGGAFGGTVGGERIAGAGSARHRPQEAGAARSR